MSFCIAFTAVEIIPSDKTNYFKFLDPFWWRDCRVEKWNIWFLLIDLDECASGDHDCHKFGICHNEIGSYTCHCQFGYVGNGTWCEGTNVIFHYSYKRNFKICIFYKTCLVFNQFCHTLKTWSSAMGSLYGLPTMWSLFVSFDSLVVSVRQMFCQNFLSVQRGSNITENIFSTTVSPFNVPVYICC